MFEVIFRFENGSDAVSVTAALNTTLLDAARNAGVSIDAPCSGSGSCGKCRVRLLKGELNSPKTVHLSEKEYQDGWRLACMSRIVADVTVFVPVLSTAFQSGIQTADLSSAPETAAFEALREKGQNRFVQMRLSMPAPTADDPMPDLERFTRAAQAAFDCKEIFIPCFVVKKLAAVLREGNFTVFAAAQRDGEKLTVMDVCTQELSMLACAIDLGTTTVAAVLLDLLDGKIVAKASVANAQIQYGADVISRIVAQRKPNGEKRLQDAVISQTLLPLTQALCKAADVDPARIFKVCIASNTVMNHLLLGVDADPIRTEPYVPTFLQYSGLKAAQLGLPFHPNADVMLSPNVGSYVGGDITAGVFASGLYDREELSLLIDLGTNGELVLGSRDYMLCCACSAGPAFEGGDISCGMRAASGAIEAVTIDRDTLQPTLTVIGGEKPVGICGSGILDIVAELQRNSVISSKGEFIRKTERVRFDENGVGRYVLADESASGREISVTSADIAALIRAKAAVFAAIRTMFSSLGLDMRELRHVYIAGGIGSGINIENAVRLGMLPDLDRSIFSYVGNTSLAGAYAMALCDDAAEKVQKLASNMTYLELSTQSQYMDEFVAACFLPHTDRTLFPSTIQE